MPVSALLGARHRERLLERRRFFLRNSSLQSSQKRDVTMMMFFLGCNFWRTHPPCARP
jgi:hypothetical protein